MFYFVHVYFLLNPTSEVNENCSVFAPHGLYGPWNSPCQNTGVGSLPFSRGSSQPRDRTQVSRIAGRFLDEPQGSPRRTSFILKYDSVGGTELKSTVEVRGLFLCQDFLCNFY